MYILPLLFFEGGGGYSSYKNTRNVPKVCKLQVCYAMKSVQIERK